MRDLAMRDLATLGNGQEVPDACLPVWVTVPRMRLYIQVTIPTSVPECATNSKVKI